MDSVNELDREASAPQVEHTTPPSISFKDFGLQQQITDAAEKLGFTQPTPVQSSSIPAVLAGKDVLAQAQTGSGKTMAFLLPLLSRLLSENISSVAGKPFALIITPTRELSQQAAAAFRTLTSAVEPAELIGGVPIRKQQNALEKDSRVVIGTPGRILDCLRQRIISFKDCSFFVLDEVDEMFSMGFFEDVRTILAKLPVKKQGIFLSATISPRVTMLAQNFLNKPENILIDEKGEDLPPIDHFVCKVGPGVTVKPDTLCNIIETQRPRSAIIFCNTKSETELVEAYLRRRGFDARRINSDLQQKQREKIMARIRSQDLQLLVATDIAARGIDIAQIELVVNYSLHEEPEQYVHRTGRTGRAGCSGRAINLVGPHDFMAFHRITKNVDVDFQDMQPPTDEEVVGARLAHFYQLVKTSDLKANEREKAMAAKFLQENMPDGEPDEDFTEMIAVVQQSFVEHYLKSDTRSLEEEVEVEERNDDRFEPRQSNSRRENNGRERNADHRSSREGYRKGRDTRRR